MRDWIEDREMLRKLEVITGAKARHAGGDDVLIDLYALDLLMRYIDTTEERLETLQSECEEQARLVGMSAEREAALLAEVERLKKLVAEQDRMLGARPCQYDRCLQHRLLRREVEAWRDHDVGYRFNSEIGELVQFL